MPKKLNGNGVKKRDTTQARRQRVLKAAARHGSITNKQAREVGEWSQVWYHLTALCELGLLKKDEFNTWTLTPKGRREIES